MGVVSRLPWWSAFPLSGGFGLVSIFAPDAFPQWLRVILFWVGVALLALGLAAAIWHFRPRGWVARHLFWRLKRHPPKAHQSTVRHNLTQVDRERIAGLILDVFDFIGAEIMPFYNELVSAICGSDPAALSALGPSMQHRQRALSRAANELWHRHSHYLEIIDLDIIPIMQGIDALRNPISNAYDARDWPQGAQQERANAVNYAFSALGGVLENIKVELREKRKEFLDV